MTTILAYIAYLVVSVALTIWVARTLHQNGRIFLIDTFRGDEQLADSVNHLLVVGFYLINIGYATVTLRFGDPPRNAQEAIEFLSTKTGLVLLVLGGMHFLNLAVFANMRRNAPLSERADHNASSPPTSRLRDSIQRTRENLSNA